MKLVLSHERLPAASPGLSGRMKVLLYSSLVFGLAVFVLAFWFAVARPVKVLPRIAPLPAFTLEDQYGLPLNAADLRGRMVFINFTYTGCGNECAAQRQSLITLRETLRAEGRLGSEVLFLTVSFDPERDTPQALQIYAAQQAAERSNWRFATGDPARLKALIGGELGLYYGSPDASGRIEHDQRMLLVDSNGMMRAKYRADTLDQSKLLRDIDLVQQELGSSGMMRQVYEASHLFLCYPD